MYKHLFVDICKCITYCKNNINNVLKGLRMNMELHEIVMHS